MKKVEASISALKATGVVSVAVGGIVATFTAEDFAQWMDVVTSYTPLLLCPFLMWWIYKVDKQHASCRSRLDTLGSALAEMRIKLFYLEKDRETRD